MKAPLSGVIPVHFQSHQAIKVLQNEYAITSADSHQPIVGSFGAGPCVILGLYDSKNQLAIVAHIDELTELDSLKILFNHISTPHTVAHLVGGYDDSETVDKEIDTALCTQIIEILEKKEIKIINADIARYTQEAGSFAIDARTGQIYSPIESYQLGKTINLEQRLESLKLEGFKRPLVQYHSDPHANLSNYSDNQTLGMKF